MNQKQIENQLEVVVNGDPHRLPSPMNLRELVAFLNLKEDRVAIELNCGIVRRDLWGETQLQDNDQLEIVQFVGGG